MKVFTFDTTPFVSFTDTMSAFDNVTETLIPNEMRIAIYLEAIKEYQASNIGMRKTINQMCDELDTNSPKSTYLISVASFLSNVFVEQLLIEKLKLTKEVDELLIAMIELIEFYLFRRPADDIINLMPSDLDNYFMEDAPHTTYVTKELIDLAGELNTDAVKTIKTLLLQIAFLMPNNKCATINSIVSTKDNLKQMLEEMEAILPAERSKSSNTLKAHILDTFAREGG